MLSNISFARREAHTSKPLLVAVVCEKCGKSGWKTLVSFFKVNGFNIITIVFIVATKLNSCIAVIRSDVSLTTVAARRITNHYVNISIIAFDGLLLMTCSCDVVVREKLAGS